MESIYMYLWYFVVYSFLGWCGEVAFAAVRQGRFVNRGFLNGPICPIYGVGLAAVCWLLGPISDNILLLYIGAAVLTTLVELITGYLMEKLFHQRWWDYSRQKWNLGGYVCLSASVAWGAACVLIVKLIHPLVRGAVMLVPEGAGKILLSVIFALLAMDLVVTVIGVRQLDRRLRQLDEAARALRKVSDGLGANVAEQAMRIKQKSEDMRAVLNAQHEKQKDRLDIVQRRILDAFPNIRSHRYPQAMETLKQWLEERRSRK